MWICWFPFRSWMWWMNGVLSIMVNLVLQKKSRKVQQVWKIPRIKSWNLFRNGLPKASAHWQEILSELTKSFLKSTCLISWTISIIVNISSVVEFQRWWVLKSNIFGQELTYSKENFSKKSVDELRFVKKCQNHTFKVNFRCQKSIEFFQKINFI